MPNPLKIDRALIEHLGELARIQVSADRQAALAEQLQRLVDAFSSLAEADFEAPATPTSQTNALTPETLRADAAKTPPGPERVLANAPQTATDCFVVPRVVDA